MGYAVDIHEGHSHSKTYGDTWEETYGVTDSTYHGAIHEYTMAGKAEFNLAACSAISLAESFEIYGGYYTACSWTFNSVSEILVE